jgi:hypothetical protein
MMRYSRRAALFILGAVSLSGCGMLSRTSGAADVAMPQLSVSADVRAAFMETISENGVRRWESENVRVAWVGPQSSIDRRTLEDTITWLSTVDGVPNLSIVEGEAEITVHRAARTEWSAILGETKQRDSADGVTITEWGASGALSRATVVLDDRSEQHQRNRTIIHELLHALGMGHHSCAGGLVYGGGDYSPVWEPDAFDTALVATLYSTALQPGGAVQEVSPQLVESGTGPSCPQVKWQSVTVRDGAAGGLWCAVGPDPRLCQGAQGSRGPRADAEIVAWLADGTAYDHDPTRFITFRLDGERVLCEKPEGSLRTPCAQTDGDTLEAPTMWTDGVELYTAPT